MMRQLELTTYPNIFTSTMPLFPDRPSVSPSNKGMVRNSLSHFSTISLRVPMYMYVIVCISLLGYMPSIRNTTVYLYMPPRQIRLCSSISFLPFPDYVGCSFGCDSQYVRHGVIPRLLVKRFEVDVRPVPSGTNQLARPPPKLATSNDTGPKYVY